MQSRTTESGEQSYQIYSKTTNQFDNFCLTIGELDDAIKTIEYFITFCETSKRGDNKSLSMADGENLRIECSAAMGKRFIYMNLRDCAGSANITEAELRKVLKELNKVKK